MLARSAALLAAVVALGCASPSASPAPPLPPPPAVPATADPPASAPAPVGPAVEPAPIACGALGCRLFDAPAAAFRAVIAERPLVLGLGEAHAQKAVPGVASSVKRFTADMLPELRDLASDLVIELMAPPTGCEAKTKIVAKELHRVTEKQADTNQNEYLAMGDEAKKLGIAPHLLYPTCDDWRALTAKGADPVDAGLLLIGRLMRESAERLLARNAKAGVEKTIVLYGGAIHNAVEPPEATRPYAFGPALALATHGRYVELDVFVPELVSDSGLWLKLPWYPHFDKKAHPEKTTLFAPLPASFTILLPATPS